MTIKTIISIIAIFLLFSCESESVIKEYNVQKLSYSKNSYIKDSLTLSHLIVNNETISGWGEDKKIPKVYVNTGLEVTQYDFNRHIYKFDFRKYYIIDSIQVAEKRGLVILRVEERNNVQILYLSLFDKTKKYLKTYLIAMDVDNGDGLIGGGWHIKSKLTNKGNLITYSLNYGYLDCGKPPYIMDSVISKYNLKTGETISVDTIKSVKPQEMI